MLKVVPLQCAGVDCILVDLRDKIPKSNGRIAEIETCEKVSNKEVANIIDY